MIASFSGEQLVDPDCDPAIATVCACCRRPTAPDAAIPPQESRALLIDLTFDSLAQAPKAVLHHLYGTGAASPPARTASAVDYLAAPFDISAGTPRVIGPPVKGPNWIALNGCCDVGWPHRHARSTRLNGKLGNSQRFAIDWKQINDTGELYVGDKTKNESFVDYGSNIYAVADGTVVATLDTEDANAPGVLPAADPVLAAKLTLENVDGNHIVQDIGGGVYAMYAHLLKGTMKVKVGDTVKKGDVDRRARQHRQRQRLAHALPADERPVDPRGRLAALRDRLVHPTGASSTRPPSRPPTTTSPGPSSRRACRLRDPRTEQLPNSMAIVDFPEG